MINYLAKEIKSLTPTVSRKKLFSSTNRKDIGTVVDTIMGHVSSANFDERSNKISQLSTFLTFDMPSINEYLITRSFIQALIIFKFNLKSNYTILICDHHSLGELLGAQFIYSTRLSESITASDLPITPFDIIPEHQGSTILIALHSQLSENNYPVIYVDLDDIDHLYYQLSSLCTQHRANFRTLGIDLLLAHTTYPFSLEADNDSKLMNNGKVVNIRKQFFTLPKTMLNVPHSMNGLSINMKILGGSNDNTLPCTSNYAVQKNTQDKNFCPLKSLLTEVRKVPHMPASFHSGFERL